LAQGSVSELEICAKKKFVELNRKGIEEGFALFLRSKNSKRDIALLVFGNALNAPTHVQLLMKLKKQG